MKKIIMILLSLFTIGLVGCASANLDQNTQKVTDFESCAAAGNPVMESYPMQCSHDGKTYVQDISKDDDLIVGGDRDEHGCIPSAGYAWSEEKQECVRPWEEENKDNGFTETFLKSNCEDNGGNWISSAKECEYISQEACEKMEGTFKECESACRNDPDAQVCTMQCVLVCDLSSETRKANCEAKDGEFNKMGMAQIEQCNTKTSDFGKECNSSEECEGLCVKGNTCSEWKINFGCIEIVEASEDVTICID